ncbi:hypothetical protein B0T16DRAFT_1393 [Cercophora newfieldiana]|uniref:Uncharacterized protein n=1 Tax=Cercophora newfieldiana TaxID=92897 RepID=A0AA39YNM3_9PEZI|nr:hypothetical protein B0T16DRAFT_1393 [Cercophora newfieldiana]
MSSMAMCRTTSFSVRRLSQRRPLVGSPCCPSIRQTSRCPRQPPLTASNLPRSCLDTGGSATFLPSGSPMGEPGIRPASRPSFYTKQVVVTFHALEVRRPFIVRLRARYHHCRGGATARRRELQRLVLTASFRGIVDCDEPLRSVGHGKGCRCQGFGGRKVARTKRMVIDVEGGFLDESPTLWLLLEASGVGIPLVGLATVDCNRSVGVSSDEESGHSSLFPGKRLPK